MTWTNSVVMKKLILFLFFSTVFRKFAQDTTNQLLSKEGCLKKSKTQKTTGLALLGTGISSLILAVTTFEIDIDPFFSSPPTNSSDNTLSSVLAVVGVSAIIGSVVDLLSSGHNKRKAELISFSRQPLFLPFPKSLVPQTQTALTLKIPINYLVY